MRYFIIAGEASGDLHASNLMRELKLRDPKAEFQFLGGDLMAEASGIAPVIHYRNMAFMGVINVLLNLRTVSHNLNVCKQSITAFNPDVVILVDYPSFNLRIAKFVKGCSSIPVFYYISPKIWAWKEYRIKQIKRYIDKMYCILPFEKEFYQLHNYEIEYVGNPTMDSVQHFLSMVTTQEEFVANNHLDSKPIVALLAGSRKQEISKCLPRMAQMAQHFPDYQFVVAGAPGIEQEFYNNLTCGLPIVFGQTYHLVHHAHVAIVNSGTATLETALLRTPQIVVYHVIGGRIASILKALVLKIKYVSLVNLIANREVVPELIAHQFTTSNLLEHLKLLLTTPAAQQTQQQGYQAVAEQLGNTKCAATAAQKIIIALQ